jgi:general L-amino acid transport system permease protein
VSELLPEEIERAAVLSDRERAVEVAPPAPALTAAEWVRANLFSSRWNGALTIAVGLVAGYVGFRLLHWAFVTADWDVVKANLRLYMVGRFPVDELWRVWTCTYLVAALAGLSWGASRARLRWTPRAIALRTVVVLLVLGFLFFLLDGVRIWVLTAVVGAIVGLGVLGGRLLGRRLLRPLALAWLVSFPIVIVVLVGFGGVPPQRWGGFLLNVLVAVVGIFVSFPVGVLLALGRRSTLPAIRTICVGLIEFVRGAPLYIWLLFGLFVLPLLLPPGLQPPIIVRAMIVFTIFSAAYVAEIVRGGLQGVHHGQYEAARALGLSTTRLTALVILPQALRNTIPSLISHFISLFKDTSLLAVIGFIDALRVARVAPQGVFQGDSKQTLLFAALLFWIVAFSMSRWSQRLERRLGVGER